MPDLRRTLVGLVAMLGLMTIVSACSSSGQADKSSSTTSPTPSTSVSPKQSSTGQSTASATITIKNYGYAGATTVAPGTEITVENGDSEAHTVTADSGSAFDVKVDPGGTATFKAPSKPGTYAYHCTYHANMHGSLRVG